MVIINNQGRRSRSFVQEAAFLKMREWQYFENNMFACVCVCVVCSCLSWFEHLEKIHPGTTKRSHTFNDNSSNALCTQVKPVRFSNLPSLPRYSHLCSPTFTFETYMKGWPHPSQLHHWNRKKAPLASKKQQALWTFHQSKEQFIK